MSPHPTPCACPGICKKPAACVQYGPRFEAAWLKQHGITKKRTASVSAG